MTNFLTTFENDKLLPIIETLDESEVTILNTQRTEVMAAINEITNTNPDRNYIPPTFQLVEDIYQECRQKLTDYFKQVNGMNRVRMEVNHNFSNNDNFDTSYIAFEHKFVENFLPLFYIENNPDPQGLNSKITELLRMLFTEVMRGKEQTATHLINRSSTIVDDIYHYFMMRIGINLVKLRLPILVFDLKAFTIKRAEDLIVELTRLKTNTKSKKIPKEAKGKESKQTNSSKNTSTDNQLTAKEKTVKRHKKAETPPTTPKKEKKEKKKEKKEEKPPKTGDLKTIFEKGNKKSSKYSTIYNKEFFNFKKVIISYMIKSNDSIHLHNISPVEIPKDIKSILALGSSFVLYRPNLYKSLSKLGMIYVKLLKYVPLEEREYIETLYQKYDEKVRQFYKSHFDSSFKTLQKLKSFLDTNDLIIKEADKNMGLTIMSKAWYDNQVLKHLNSDNYVKECPNYEKIISELEIIMEICPRAKISPERLRRRNFDIPRFYILPKIHKNPIASRPIVPNFDWLTTEASIWLHSKLWPIVERIPWIAKNSLEVVHELDNLTFEKAPYVFSIDVVSMYTNIDNDDGVTGVLRYLIEYEGMYYKKVQFIYKLLEWVLRHNYFTYGGQSYRQAKGTAMGSNVAPAYANLFMAFHESEMWKVLPKPLLYKRYLDDILIVVETEEEFHKYFNYMNNMSRSLKFTYVKCENHLAFLDLKISLKRKFETEGKLDYELFQKPENNNIYYNPLCEVKPAIKFGWITGENIRLLRISCSKKAFKQSISLFKKKLIERGYTNEIINEYLKFKYKHRTLFYNKEDKQVDENPPKYIICEADVLDRVFTKFIHKINCHYDNRVVLVAKNFHKLMDELNHQALKVLQPEEDLFEFNLFD